MKESKKKTKNKKTNYIFLKYNSLERRFTLLKCEKISHKILFHFLAINYIIL